MSASRAKWREAKERNAMGIGSTLLETKLYRRGRVLSPRFGSHRLPMLTADATTMMGLLGIKVVAW